MLNRPILVPTPRDFESVDLRWDLEICLFNRNLLPSDDSDTGSWQSILLKEPACKPIAWLLLWNLSEPSDPAKNTMRIVGDCKQCMSDTSYWSSWVTSHQYLWPSSQWPIIHRLWPTWWSYNPSGLHLMSVSPILTIDRGRTQCGTHWHPHVTYKYQEN